MAWNILLRQDTLSYFMSLCGFPSPCLARTIWHAKESSGMTRYEQRQATYKSNLQYEIVNEEKANYSPSPNGGKNHWYNTADLASDIARWFCILLEQPW